MKEGFGMFLGVPREILENERRVAALPEAVSEYVKMGFKVLVESSAGEGVLRSDKEYEEAGAEIQDAESLFARSDLIIKVKEPCLNPKVGKHEVEMMKEGSTLITFLHPAAPSNHEMVRMLQERNITSLTMDGIPRTSRAQRMDALTAMSTVAGYKAVLIAANHFPKLVPMVSTAIGTIKPARFLVIGVGVVGLQAIATAKRLGGIVTAMDIRADAREAAMSLGAKLPVFDVPQDLAVGEGGYAKALPPEWLEKEREILKPVVADSDIMILSALVPGEQAPILITEEMIQNMRPGSVIIDVAIDQGGNCEITKAGKEIVKHNVVISGTQNIPGSMPVHSSWLYSHNMLEYIKNLFKSGLDSMDMADDIVRSSLVTYEGKIVHQGTLKAMGK